ncbi:MAG: 5-formyltetrahydrofolate cyclo-ligase [Clostridiales bacterium]|nr:5-formyltetrahydrofolate cyclo-ligase [Clostridiales bacterium]
MESKAELRKKILSLRDNIDPDEREDKSRKICEILLAEPWYESSDKILVYAAIKSEVSLKYFCECALRDGKKLYFPRTDGDKMEFFGAEKYEDFSKGNFGVMEPIGDDIFSEENAPILAPGAAFSESGQRIGYGKGYYDRYLATRPKLFPVGICFSAQIVKEIDADEHDIPMRAIAYENGVKYI